MKHFVNLKPSNSFEVLNRSLYKTVHLKWNVRPWEPIRPLNSPSSCQCFSVLAPGWLPAYLSICHGKFLLLWAQCWWEFMNITVNEPKQDRRRSRNLRSVRSSPSFLFFFFCFDICLHLLWQFVNAFIIATLHILTQIITLWKRTDAQKRARSNSLND